MFSTNFVFLSILGPSLHPAIYNFCGVGHIDVQVKYLFEHISDTIWIKNTKRKISANNHRKHIMLEINSRTCFFRRKELYGQ